MGTYYQFYMAFPFTRSQSIGLFFELKKEVYKKQYHCVNDLQKSITNCINNIGGRTVLKATRKVLNVIGNV